MGQANGFVAGRMDDWQANERLAEQVNGRLVGRTECIYVRDVHLKF